MTVLTDVKYTFTSDALPADKFGVVKFHGSEGLSRPYEFNILLAAEDPEIDLTRVLNKPAVFTIKRPDGDIPFHGLLVRFEQMHAFQDYVFYRAVLVPKFRWLSLTFHNQVFLDMTLPDILAAVLKDGGLTEADFELRLEKDYKAWEYVCQYRESHFDFASRWMERDGIYYFFEQGEDREKLIITDSSTAHVDMPQGGSIIYSPPSGLDDLHIGEVIQNFTWRQQMLPREVLLKDYNYRTPSLELTGSAQIKNNGYGSLYMYGDHFRTPEEGDALAKVRAEEMLCREKTFAGSGRAPFLRPGYTFTLKQHFRDQLNQKYLTITLEHEGSQTAYLTAGLRQAFPGEEELFYRNSFTAIEANRQFRPERKTEKARFYGAMNATIDAAGSGQYAELDDKGRYKVILPFDRSGRKDGKASAFLRMMQPYGGSNHGLHFPLHKGVEVLLTFIDGDPDRPVIAGAVPNPDNPSQVNDQSHTQCRLTTSGQNRIHIEDKAGSERILMHSPTADSFIRIGAPNDPVANWGKKPDWHAMEDERDGIKLVTTQGFDIKATTANEIILGETTTTTGGFDWKVVVGEEFGINVIHLFKVGILAQTDVKIAAEWSWGPGLTEMVGTKKKVIPERVSASAVRKAVRAKLDKMQASVEKASGNVDKIRGKVNQAVGEAMHAFGDLQDINARAQRVHGELIDANIDANQVKGQVTNVIGAANRAKESLKEVTGDLSEVAGDMTSIANDFKSTTAARFREAGIDSTL